MQQIVERSDNLAPIFESFGALVAVPFSNVDMPILENSKAVEPSNSTSRMNTLIVPTNPISFGPL